MYMSLQLITINVYIISLIDKIAMCKKPYPNLIHKKLEKNITTHGYKKYPRSLCSSNSTYTTSHPCRFGPFILRHD